MLRDFQQDIQFGMWYNFLLAVTLIFQEVPREFYSYIYNYK